MTEAKYSADPFYEEYSAEAYKRSVDGYGSKEETVTSDEEVVKTPPSWTFSMESSTRGWLSSAF